MRTRARSWPLVAGAAALLAFLIAGVAIIAALTGNGGCESQAASGPPSKQAERDIPATFLALYQQVAAKYRIPWPVLAGIGREECDHGRDPDPSCTPQPGASGPGVANFAGAAGPMQIGVGGAAGDEFSRVKVDFDGDGKTGTHDPADAIAMAALVLIKDKGAPQGKDIDAYRTAVRAYNGSGPQAEAYTDRVIADAHTYASGANPVADSGGCSGDAGLTLGGPAGKVTIAPGADRPGVSVQPIVLRYVAAMAGLAGRPIVITTGTNHNQYTVDGNVSDHWDGHAADLGMAANGGTDDGPVGDTLMTSCLVLAGVPPDKARSQAVAGGLYTLEHDRLRIQCIWKTNQGGNHHNHVHVGVRPT